MNAAAFSEVTTFTVADDATPDAMGAGPPGPPPSDTATRPYAPEIMETSSPGGTTGSQGFFFWPSQ